MLPWVGSVAPATGQNTSGQTAPGQSVYREVEVDDGAALTGMAVFRGEIPEPRRLLVTKDEEVCGFGYLERTEVNIGEDRGLAGVVVVVQDIQEGKAWPESPGGYVLDQKDCVFLPHLLVVPQASEVDIINSDPVLHNVHAYELIDGAGRSMFNLGQPPSDLAIVQQIRPRFGNVLRLECDAHDFMQSWIYAADSPYWAVTGEDGAFVIDDVPPGEYSITAWHPSLGVQQRVVTLGVSGAAELDLVFTNE